VGFSTKRCPLVAPVSSASLFLPCLLPAKIAAVALSAVAMRADAEDGFTSIAASWTKQGLRHVLDDKPPLRFGDDAEGSLSNRRVIKKPRFLMRGDSMTDISKNFPRPRVLCKHCGQPIVFNPKPFANPWVHIDGVDVCPPLAHMGLMRGSL
jgi:hypothetical protein